MELQDWLIVLMRGIIRTFVWIIPLIAGIIMVKRGGEKPERFFLTGSALMFLYNTVKMAQSIHTRLIMTGNVDRESFLTLGAQMSRVNLIYYVFTSLFFLAGMVLLVYAFRLRFKKVPDAPVGGNTAKA
jgi:hypothetical protein